MIGIKAHTPCRLLPIASHEPCPQMITLFVGKRAIGGIAPCREKGMPKRTGRGTVVHNLHATILLQIGCSAKLRGHFQSQFHRKGHLSLGVPYHHIARLAVVKRTLRVAMLPLGETLLPATVGGFAISYMPFQAQPAVGEGHYPIAGQRKPHLRNRPCIDAQRLIARGELSILQGHGLCFAAKGEQSMSPTHLYKDLLHPQRAAKATCCGQLYPIAHAPFPCVIVRNVARQLCNNRPIRRGQRAPSIAISHQPKRCLPMRLCSL